jgi:hypothetical protein
MSGSKPGRSQSNDDPENHTQRHKIARANSKRKAPTEGLKKQFLDDIEKTIRSIAQPVDNAAIYQLQVQYVLDRAGFYVIREVPMTEMRRLDLVAIRDGITGAIEIDKCNPLARSYKKMLDIPKDILRVVVLRRRLKDIDIKWADRCIAVRSHLRMVSWLCDGRITDMESMAATHHNRGELVPLREELVVAPSTRGNHGARR